MCGFTCELAAGYKIQKSRALETHERSLIILSHSEVQAGFRLGAAIPQTPLKAVASSEFSRSTTQSKRVTCKYVCSNRYDLYKAEHNNLEEELTKYRHQHEGVDENWCRAFLKEHGNMTHYISSITLGAMTYEMQTTEERNLRTKLGAGVDSPLGGVIEGNIGLKREHGWSEIQKGMIGKFEEDGKTVIQERAIFYDYAPLSQLITDENMKQCLEDAVKSYLEERYLPVEGKTHK